MSEPPLGWGAVGIGAFFQTLAYVNCNERLSRPRNTIAVHGTRGRIVGTGLTRSRNAGDLTVSTDRGETVTHYPVTDAHRHCLAAFARAILRGTEPTPSGIDGLRTVELCEAIERSARERRLVEVGTPEAPLTRPCACPLTPGRADSPSIVGRAVRCDDLLPGMPCRSWGTGLGDQRRSVAVK